MGTFECGMRLNGETIDVEVEYDEDYQVCSVYNIETGAPVSLRSTGEWQYIENRLYDHLMEGRQYLKEG